MERREESRRGTQECVRHGSLAEGPIISPLLTRAALKAVSDMLNWLRDFPQDLQYAVRLVRKSPGFVATAVLTLALGIGANTALFSVVNGVLLNPLPYPHSGQLVAVYGKTPGFDQGPVVYLNFLDWQRDTQTFSSMAIYRNQDYNVTGSDEAERLSGYMISADFFSTLGVRPVLGRAFRPDDDRGGRSAGGDSGRRLVERKFGASPDVLGKPLILNGTSYTIVGVIPAGFTFYGHDRDVYTPIGQWNDPSFRDRRISVSAHVVGRLKTGRDAPAGQSRHGRGGAQSGGRVPVADQKCRDHAGFHEGRYCGQRPAVAAGAAGGGGISAADCVRERRQSSAGALHGPLARVCRSRGPGRRPRAGHAAASH